MTTMNAPVSITMENGEKRPITLNDVKRLAQQVHPDVMINLLNVFRDAEVVFRHNGQELTIPQFGRHLSFNRGPASYCEAGLSTIANASFLRDPQFNKAYKAARDLGGWGMEIRWSTYNSVWAAAQVMSLEGDVVECGVWKGGWARAVIEYTDFASTGKTMWLLDTFEGIDDEQLTDEERSMGIGTKINTYAKAGDVYQEVCRTFADEPYVKIIKGSVPGTLDQVTCEKICLLQIDMNNATPEIAAFNALWDRCVPGAIVILDDYAWQTHPVQKREFDKLADKMGLEILTMPTGQGFIFKK